MWGLNDLECLAVVWTVGRKEVIRTDGKVTKTLLMKKNLSGKHARWADKLNELSADFTFLCAGASNVIGETLSRSAPPESRIIQNGNTTFEERNNRVVSLQPQVQP